MGEVFNANRGEGGGKGLGFIVCIVRGGGSNIQGRSEKRSGGCNLMPEFNRLVSAYI